MCVCYETVPAASGNCVGVWDRKSMQNKAFFLFCRHQPLTFSFSALPMFRWRFEWTGGHNRSVEHAETKTVVSVYLFLTRAFRTSAPKLRWRIESSHLWFLFVKVFVRVCSFTAGVSFCACARVELEQVGISAVMHNAAFDIGRSLVWR